MKFVYLIIVSCFLISTTNASLEEIFGNAGNGDNCASDYQCESLCCNKNLGYCGPHNPTGEVLRFCNKPIGESCITSEFCNSESVVVCKIYKSGTKLDGTPACIMRCPSTKIRGTCVNETCQGPRVPPIPPFDPNDCSQAIDP
jgi:hypothetical protein